MEINNKETLQDTLDSMEWEGTDYYFMDYTSRTPVLDNVEETAKLKELRDKWEYAKDEFLGYFYSLCEKYGAKDADQRSEEEE